MDSCIITGLPIFNYKESNTDFGYSIKYKGKEYKLKFPLKVDLFENYKKALKSLLFRDEWPFDEDYPITRLLFERMLRYREYPNERDFDKKVLAYLEWLYTNGGKEHKILTFEQSEYWQACANDDEEFYRIYEDLEHKGFITTPIDNEFKLAKGGIKTVEEIIAKRPEKILNKYSHIKKPRIGIICVEEDYLASGKLYNYFSNKMFPTLTVGRFCDDGTLNNSLIHNIRHNFSGEEGEFSADYWIFIKSANSDINNGYGSLLNIAMENHREKNVSIYPNMISMASIDDSNFYAWPRYIDYGNYFYDVRLEPGKERLLDTILLDWVNILDKKLKTKDDFWNWLLDLCKQLKNNSILIRPYNIRGLIDSEEQLSGFLAQLVAEKVITLRELPGCRNDKLEYEVRVLTDEEKNPGGNEEPLNIYLDLSPIECLERILKNFHKMAVKLRERREDRPTIEINDEYDVQDLLYSLLQMYFHDVRKEDYTMSTAGSNSKPDFILKNENIGIEVKMTNDNLRDKKIGDQLLIDIGRYKSHANCKTLVIFIYDKGDYLRNKAGLIRDLEKQKTMELDVKVYIVPTQ